MHQGTKLGRTYLGWTCKLLLFQHPTQTVQWTVAQIQEYNPRLYVCIYKINNECIEWNDAWKQRISCVPNILSSLLEYQNMSYTRIRTSIFTIKYVTEHWLQIYGCFLKWWYKHPKMIIFSRKNHGCWVPPFKETPISIQSSVSLRFLPSPSACLFSERSTAWQHWSHEFFARQVTYPMFKINKEIPQ